MATDAQASWADKHDPEGTTSTPWHEQQVEPADTPDPVLWQRGKTAENVQATWTPQGLQVAFWTGTNGITTVRFDEAGQQALRDALGTR